MRRMLHTTTAIVASLSLSLPGAVAAQTADLSESQIEACRNAAEGGGADPLVVTVDGADVACPPVAELTAAEAEAEVPAEAEAPAEPEAEAEVEVPAEAEVEPEAVETEAPAEAEAEAPAEVEVEAPAEVEVEAPAEAEVEAPVEVEVEAPAEAEVEAPVEAEVEAEAPAETAPEAQAVVGAAEGAAAADGETAAEPVDGAEPLEGAAPVEGAAPAEGAAPVESAAPAEGTAPAEGAAVQPAPAAAAGATASDAGETETETTGAADAIDTDGAAETADAPAGAEPAAEEPAAVTDPAAAPPAEAEAEAEAQAEAELPPEVAPAPEATVDVTVSDADALAPEGEGEVTTEMLTEETTRSSSEDFTTALTAEASEADANEGERLSDFERALLVGAGALVVGSMLRGGREVVATSGDRTIVERNGQFEVIKDDNALLRQAGSEVQTETFSDGSTRTTILREDGSRIVTIRDPELRVLRRTRITADGQEIALIDDTAAVEPVDVSRLPQPAPAGSYADDAVSLRAALAAESQLDRRFSLYQVRDIREVRELAPSIDVGSVTFATGSAAITPDQARTLDALGQTVAELIRENPREVFLVEGHTDAVGSAAMNLALSDRRAESLALALTEYFDVPPENLVVQGYGERFLRVPTQTAERENRRVAVRRITPLLQTAAAN